jgi:catechol-2,3-dioxygenase
MPSNDIAANKVRSPASLVHVVLRTSPENFSKVNEFYKIFLAAAASYENDWIAFLSYDEEHHRVAVVGMKGTGDKQDKTCGLEHFSFA